MKMDNNGVGWEKLTAHGSKEAMIQNMKDAGCSRETIECCINCLDYGKETELLERLSNHREGLLHKVHEGEKQIGCLDYLVYQIDRSRSENEI